MGKKNRGRPGEEREEKGRKRKVSVKIFIFSKRSTFYLFIFFQFGFCNFHICKVNNSSCRLLFCADSVFVIYSLWVYGLYWKLTVEWFLVKKYIVCFFASPMGGFSYIIRVFVFPVSADRLVIICVFRIRVSKLVCSLGYNLRVYFSYL